MSKKTSCVVVILAGLLLPFLLRADPGVALNPPATRPLRAGYEAALLAHAWPDEYFYGVGSISNLYMPDGIDPTNCPAGAVPKVNQAYVWGMGKAGDDIYFGTLANGESLVAEVYLALLGQTNTYSFVQEGYLGYYGWQHGGTGDWRPPHLFRYNIPARSLTCLDATLPPADQSNLLSRTGIRAGGAASTNKFNSQRMVLLAGPSVNHDTGGVAFFVFDATATQFVGSVVHPEWSNIRRFVDVNGDLYAGVQRTGVLGGSVIRWVNNPATPGYPFAFQEVGLLDQMGADICLHQGRLFVTTWPGYVEDSLATLTNLNPLVIYRSAPGLWMSPVVPSTGLTTAQRTQWSKIWSVANYEPDTMVALTLGGGALASFDGYLYFGTMQVPYTGTVAYDILYGLPQQPTNLNLNAWTNYFAQTYLIYTNTARAASLFRVHNFRQPLAFQGNIIRLGGDFELLYGSTKMPVFNGTGWTMRANKMGQTPSMGAAGFGNVSNCYVWSMAVCSNTLYVGTFKGGFPADPDSFAFEATNPASLYGADLYCLPSSRASRLQPVSLNGLGNICNYGVRTMVADPDALYVGTANPCNMLADPYSTLPIGGWELLRVSRHAAVRFDMDGDFAADPAWITTNHACIVFRSATADTNLLAGPANSQPAWADYDNDGIADPAWCNPATGVWQARFSSRNGQLLALPNLSLKNAVPVPADFDGDGKADPALCQVSNGRIKWRSSKTGKTFTLTPPLAAAIPAIGDYNGDGAAEIVWYVSASNLIIRAANPSAAVFTREILTNGFRGVPVPADYDGDGKTDFALHDPLTGKIHVWCSAGGEIESAAPGPVSQWLPMPADYDGGGKASFAWFNPSNNTMRIQSSTLPADPEDLVFSGLPPNLRPIAAPAAVWYTKY